MLYAQTGLRRALAVMMSLVLVLSEVPLPTLRHLAWAEDDAFPAPAEVASIAETGITPEFSSLNDPALNRYIEDVVYDAAVRALDSDEYFVENVETAYVSTEYLEELAYNSQSNIFFGYTLAEIEECFQGTRYVFTLGDDGTTVVKAFEGYDDTYDQVVRNVAIGGGVILLCVTVSAVTAGAGMPAASMIFAMSAKSGTVVALSSAAIGGVAAGICTGIETGNFDDAAKAAELAASEGFAWGAIGGGLAGGLSEAVMLHGATLGGLSMNEAATIQRESHYPLDVIQQFKTMKQYEIAREAGLTAGLVDGKTALVRNIDLEYVDEFGRTNLQRMREGLAALDPATGKAYELHHIGQKTESTLAILTQDEHRLGDNYMIWHSLEESGVDHGGAWAKQRTSFWKSMYENLK